MTNQDANSVDFFFSLLRSGLYGAPVPEAELPESVDWKSVVGLARKHAVYGVIIDAVQLLPDRLLPPKKGLVAMSRFSLGLFETNLIVDKAAARLAAFLKRHGIDGVLLKGQGVARYYRQPQMRHCGDIDYYVGKKKIKEASALCREKLADDKDACEDGIQHFSFDMDGVHIELHRLATRVYSPFKYKRIQKWIVEELEQSGNRRELAVGNSGATIPVPSVDFDAIYIFYHAWRHYIQGGIGLRQLSDWTMLFYSSGSEIDIEKLKDNIHRFGLETAWKLFACIAVEYLGLPAERMPLYDPAYSRKSEKVLQKVMDGGNFGFYSATYTDIPLLGHGLKHGFSKTWNEIKNLFSLLPLAPVEAMSFYLQRLVFGPINYVQRTLRKSRKK